MILEYIESIGFYLLCFTAFSKLVTLAFNVIQIPFAIISRTAVYFVLAFRTYFLSLFFAVMTLAIFAAGYIPLPFLLTFSPVLFAEIVAPFYKSDNDSSVNTYIGCSAFIAVIIYLALYFSGYTPGSQIPILFMQGVSWLLGTAILGDIISFVLPLASFVTCLLVVVHMAIIIFVYFSSLINKPHQKKDSKIETVSHVVPDQASDTATPEKNDESVSLGKISPEQRYRPCAECGSNIPYPEYQTQTLCRACRAKAEALFLMRDDIKPKPEPATSVSRPAPLYCRLCGAQLHDDSLFCEYCGTPISTDEQPNK